MGASRTVAVALLLSGFTVAAEEAPRDPLTIEQAVRYALAHHPALAVSTAVEEAGQARVAVARAGYLPDVALAAELEVGTGNVLRGALFPARDIPAVSGPPT